MTCEYAWLLHHRWFPHFTNHYSTCWVFSVFFVFTSCSLVTASNHGDSSTALTKSSLHRLPYNLPVFLTADSVQSQSQSQYYFMTGDLPPVSLSCCQAPWESRPEIFFFNRTLAVVVSMKHLSDEKPSLSLSNMLGLLSIICITHITCYWKIVPFALYSSPLSVQALQSRSCLSYLSYTTMAA
jgi:hypothetical protein